MKEFAPGIPSNKPKYDLPTTSTPQDWKIVVQKHTTKKGGHTRTHFDLRLNPPNSDRAHSWAIPRAILPKPGEKTLAVETFTHKADYMPFTGIISQGYGMGKVERELLDTAEVLMSSPDKIKFNLYNQHQPNEYALVRTGGDNWILLNTTMTKKKLGVEVPPSRPKYDKITADKFLKHPVGIVMPKMSGAFSTTVIGKKDIRVFSHREPKRNTTGLIEYTHKIPGLTGAKLESLAGTSIQSELVARKGKNIAKEQVIAGILNSSVRKSRESQKQHGNLESWAFDISKYKGKDLSNMLYPERRKLLASVVRQIPSTKLMPAVSKPGEALKLYKEVKRGKHPLTREGLVVVQPGNNKFSKLKFRDDYDVYIRGFQKGTGKYEDNGVGAILYSFSPAGPIVGKVGTGFSDKLRKNMHDNPKSYLNKVIRVKSNEVFTKKDGSIVLHTPSFIDFHPDKN